MEVYSVKCERAMTNTRQKSVKEGFILVYSIVGESCRQHPVVITRTHLQSEL